jgi:GntR family transcriptional regulator/MocR family aminotransferase
LQLHLRLTSRRDVCGQLYRQIRDAILDGRLRAGEALPSTRELTRHAGISRNTVLLAYERLRAEGFITSRVGAGTFVSDGIRPRTSVHASDSPLKPRAVWDEIPEGIDMSATRAEFDLRPGIPDVSSFPFAAWRARLSRQFHPGPVGSAAHIGAAGHAGLRTAIARHVALSRGVRATADDVLVTNGSQQAIDLIVRAVLEPGDVVAVEDPGYPLPRRLFHAYGCRVAGVPVDGDGLVVDAIPRRARLVYVTPSHQYPLGMAMSMARRQALLEWADQHDGIVLEDDYDSEFRYGGRSLEPLQSLDGCGRVLYVGSFSKVMLPTLRLGFLVAPAPLRSALCKAKYLTDWHTALPTQAAAALFIDDGLLAHHIRRMCRVYAERHERIRRVLLTDFHELLTPLPSVGGLHLTTLIERPSGSSDIDIARRAHAAGVAVLPLSYHHVSNEPRPGLLIGYGAIATDRIEEGLDRLRGCL